MSKPRKTPKPKPPTHERIHRDSDPMAVYDVLDEMVKKHHQDLAEEKCRIALAWRYGWKRNKDGQLILGKCKKASDLDKQFSEFDFVVILNREAWVTLEPAQREALMDHELCHAAVALDPNGNVKKDARNRTCFRVKKHDVEEFGDIILRHGCYKQDLEQFCLAAMKSNRPPQPSIPGLDEPAEKDMPEPSANGIGHEPSANGTAHPPKTMAAAARKRPVPRSHKVKQKSK